MTGEGKKRPALPLSKKLQPAFTSRMRHPVREPTNIEIRLGSKSQRFSAFAECYTTLGANQITTATEPAPSPPRNVWKERLADFRGEEMPFSARPPAVHVLAFDANHGGFSLPRALLYETRKSSEQSSTREEMRGKETDATTTLERNLQRNDNAAQQSGTTRPVDVRRGETKEVVTVNVDRTLINHLVMALHIRTRSLLIQPQGP